MFGGNLCYDWHVLGATFDSNSISPGGLDQGQPTHLLPGRQWGVLTVIVAKTFGERKLIWTLTANGSTVEVPVSFNPL